ncbi:MAG: polyprenyl synthetase family protein [Owenweeksia sp.]
MNRIEHYVRLVENTLARQDLDHQPSELYEPISYILHLGGKRLRPALTLAACELFEGQAEDALMPAIAIEVFHNFTLIHDDIMDAAPVRRGQPTVHKKWDTNIAILSGDAMLVKAYQYLAQVDKDLLPAVLKVFSQTAIEVCEGQQYDMNFETREGVSEEEYIEMIRLKTSVLLGCALKTGAIIARTAPENAEAIYRFGIHIGIAFQIQDDLLDAFGESGKVGKQTGGDILQDKKTLLMIYALSRSSELKNLLGPAIDPDEKVKQVKFIFEKSGARDHAQKTMEHHFEQALANLQQTRGNAELKKELEAFARYLIIRDK